MSGYVGLVELVLVFAFVLGLGIYELRSVRRATLQARDKAAAIKAPEACDPPL